MEFVSYAVYIGMAVVCCFFAVIADRTDKKIYTWVLILLVSIFAGIRSATVGLDTVSYLEKFDAIKFERFDLAYGLEVPFKCIVYLLLLIVPRGWFVLTVLALLTNWCIISRFWMLRNKSCFPCMVLCYYMSYFCTTLNIMRQFCAVAIVFYAVRYLEEKKVWKYLCAVLLAMLIHKSAVIGVLYFIFYYVHWDQLPENHKRLLKIGIMVLPIFAVMLVLLIIFGNYLKYFAHIQVDFGLMLPLKAAFLLASVVVCFRGFRKQDFLQMPFAERFTLITAGGAYLVALGIGMLGYFFEGMDRLALYFFLFEAVYFGILLKQTRKWHRLIAACFIVFVIGYGFLYCLAHNSQGQMPYRITGEIISLDGYDDIGGNYDETGEIAGVMNERLNGIVNEDGVLCYYENNRRVYAGLVVIDGYYYYVRRNGELVTRSSCFVSKTNGLIPADEYHFNSKGQIMEFIKYPLTKYDSQNISISEYWECDNRQNEYI